MTWLGNVRVPAETMRDLSDVEWLEGLRKKFGEDRVVLYKPKDAAGRTAAEWEARGMSGVYLTGSYGGQAAEISEVGLKGA